MVWYLQSLCPLPSGCYSLCGNPVNSHLIVCGGNNADAPGTARIGLAKGDIEIDGGSAGAVFVAQEGMACGRQREYASSYNSFSFSPLPPFFGVVHYHTHCNPLRYSMSIGPIIAHATVCKVAPVTTIAIPVFRLP